MDEQSRNYRPLVWLLAAFIVLALLYSRATPIFEASDELWHFGMVQHIAETGELPVQNPDLATAWEQEGSQPPLYYMIAAALIAPLDRADFDALRQPNPHAKAGIPGAWDNKNLVLHPTSTPALQGTAFAVTLVRLFSIVLGCITVSAVYSTALYAAGWWSDRSHLVATGAAALTAFNPMFLFITASVNNDNLVTALNSLVIWQMVVMLQNGLRNRRSLVLALLLALGALSKLSALVLTPVVGLAALWLLVYGRHHPLAIRRRRFLIFCGLVVGVGLLLAGWWYLRNITLYGELFGTQMMVAVAGGREGPFTLNTLISEFEGFRIAYWGLFGAVNIMTFGPFYVLMDILTIVGVIGLVAVVNTYRRIVAREDRISSAIRRNASFQLVVIGLLLLLLVIGSIAVIAWTAQTYASQGRLLFPYIAAINTLLALGLNYVLGRLKLWSGFKRFDSFAQGGIVAFGLFALAVPIVTIAPQYTPPPPQITLPDSANPVFARYDAVELIGYETPNRRFEPGDQMPVTVYWRVRRNTERDLSLYLHATNPDGEVIGKVDSYPGGGRLRTSTWQPGMIYADTYAIPLTETTEGRFPVRIQVGWWHFPSGEVVTPINEHDARLESVMLDAGGFAGDYQPDLPDDLITVEGADFGSVVRLVGYQNSESLFTFVWEATGTLDVDYKVFVQALDPTASTMQVVAQGDAPPAFPTRYWRAGERYVTHHVLTFDNQRLIPGEFNVIIGWYEEETFRRLSTGLRGDTFELTTITVNAMG